MLNFDAKFKNLTFGTHQISFTDEDNNNYDVVIEVGKPKNREKNNGIKIGTNRPPFYLTINSTIGDYKLRISFSSMQYISNMLETSRITEIIPILINVIIDQQSEDRKINVIKKYMSEKYDINGLVIFFSMCEIHNKKKYYEFNTVRDFKNSCINSELHYLLIRFGVFPIFFKDKKSYTTISHRYSLIMNFDVIVDVPFTENDIKIFDTIPE